MESEKLIYVNSVDVIDIDERAEGGASRDYAFNMWIKTKNIKSIVLVRNKVKNLMKIIHLLIFTRGKKIIFQYPRIGIPVYNNSLIGKLISKTFLLALKISCKNNTLIFDISDIKYEQLKDLNINLNNIEQIKKFENQFFNLPLKFIFASYSMKEYISEKFNISNLNAEVCINGGLIKAEDSEDKGEKDVNDNNLKFVYAGTLNKGRQIEDIISIFTRNPQNILILMGTDGEWIEYLNLAENIKYLGALREDEAHRLVAKCDVGLIPYDESKLYYNIAYPTKLSFYITAEIAFISTPVKEVKFIKDKFNIGYIAPIDEWENLINKINKTDVLEQQYKVKKVKDEFYWNNIFEKSKFIKNYSLEI